VNRENLFYTLAAAAIIKSANAECGEGGEGGAPHEGHSEAAEAMGGEPEAIAKLKALLRARMAMGGGGGGEPQKEGPPPKPAPFHPPMEG
jgi:hypothetical protein